jgi:methylmalonyl-CoA mutase cobalamin-binding domain/chain
LDDPTHLDEQNAADSTNLALMLADLNENEVLRIVQARIKRGDDPLQIMEDCQAGMREVGERYAQRRYFLSALIMAGDILREVMELVQPSVEEQFSGRTSGRILIGTVQGDIHDLGKNLLLMLLRCYGFTVLDLGVDVPPERFVQAVAEFQPDVIGLSGLLTASFEAMRVTVSQLRAAGARTIPIVLGGQVDAQVCRYAGADYWMTDAMEGVRLCQRLTGDTL